MGGTLNKENLQITFTRRYINTITDIGSLFGSYRSRIYSVKESISKELNKENNLNLQDQRSGGFATVQRWSRHF